MSVQDIEDEDYNPDIYTLTDENGDEQAFELLDILEYKGERYFALMPYYENDYNEMLSDDGELVILKSEMDGDDELMISIDDEAEYNEVGEKFIEQLSDFFEEIISD